jgi:dihydrofolate reductase
MRKLVVLNFVSLDGVVQAPGHNAEDTDGGFSEGGWTEPYMADHRNYGAVEYTRASAFLFGRRTYEIWVPHWSTITNPDDVIAAALNRRPKYVATTTLREVSWPGAQIIDGDLASAVRDLKQEAGGPIVVPGSGQLVHSLTAANLVDRYQIWIHPVAVGAGKRLFDKRTDLRLTRCTTTPTGVVILDLEPARFPSDTVADAAARSAETQP